MKHAISTKKLNLQRVKLQLYPLMFVSQGMEWVRNNFLEHGLPFNCVCGTYELVVIFIYQHLQVSIEILYLSSHFDMPLKHTFQIGLLHLYVWWNIWHSSQTNESKVIYIFSTTRKDGMIKGQLTPWARNRLSKDLSDKYKSSQYRSFTEDTLLKDKPTRPLCQSLLLWLG